MADCNDPTGPATPELPFTIHVDGNLGAVEFVRRLHMGGMEMRNAEDGSYAVIVRAERPLQPVRGLRRRLFEASGVVYAVRFALDNSDGNLDEVQLASALEGAGKILDDVAALLEGAEHE